MKRLLSTLLLVFLFFVSVVAWPQVTVSGQHSPYAKPPAQYELEDVQIMLERTECFGTCPIYKVRISGDGSVVYTGEEHVRVAGTQEAALPKSAVLGLLDEVYGIYFFEMRDSYREGPPGIIEQDGVIIARQMAVTDVPSAIVTVRLGAYEKRVTVIPYFNTPASLIALTERIDRESGVLQWVE